MIQKQQKQIKCDKCAKEVKSERESKLTEFSVPSDGATTSATCSQISPAFLVTVPHKDDAVFPKSMLQSR